jgi:hypothetical protein
MNVFVFDKLVYFSCRTGTVVMPFASSEFAGLVSDYAAFLIMALYPQITEGNPSIKWVDITTVQGLVLLFFQAAACKTNQRLFASRPSTGSSKYDG